MGETLLNLTSPVYQEEAKKKTRIKKTGKSSKSTQSIIKGRKGLLKK